MTEIEAYQEYIRIRHNAFCKAVIRHAAIGKIIRLQQKWEREISLDYLVNEKFIQFAGSEPDEEYPFTVCGQTVLLSDPEAVNAVLLHYDRYIRYFSKVNGQVNAEVEDYVKQQLIAALFKFRYDR